MHTIFENFYEIMKIVQWLNRTNKPSLLLYQDQFCIYSHMRNLHSWKHYWAEVEQTDNVMYAKVE